MGPMGYDRGDSFPLDFEPNGFPFGSKSKGKLSPRSYPIRFERKWKSSFLSVSDGRILNTHVTNKQLLILRHTLYKFINCLGKPYITQFIL